MTHRWRHPDSIQQGLSPKQRVDQLAVNAPGLAVILSAGEDAASQVYVLTRSMLCAQAGIHSEK